MNNVEAIDRALDCLDHDFLKALTEPARIEILKLLVTHGGCDIGTLAEKMPQDRSVISRHLSYMQRAGLLKATKQGRHVTYTVDGDGLVEKVDQMAGAIRRCVELGCC